MNGKARQKMHFCKCRQTRTEEDWEQSIETAPTIRQRITPILATKLLASTIRIFMKLAIGYVDAPVLGSSPRGPMIDKPNPLAGSLSIVTRMRLLPRSSVAVGTCGDCANVGAPPNDCCELLLTVEAGRAVAAARCLAASFASSAATAAAMAELPTAVAGPRTSSTCS